MFSPGNKMYSLLTESSTYLILLSQKRYNFNTRGGASEHHDFVEQLKGKDTSFSQINGFITKVSWGNAEQTLSRDIFRLAQQMDLTRHMSFYYTSVGHFYNALFSLGIMFVLLYCKLFMGLTGAEADLYELKDNKWVSRVQAALFGSQLVQFTVMTMIAGVFCLAIEKSLYESIKTHLSIIGRGGLMFFSFILGTKALSYQNKILYGDGGYVGTGRGLGLQHEPFSELYRQHGSNQILLGFEIAFALIVYRYLSGIHLDDNRNQLNETFPLVLVAISFIWTPFILNPSALNCDVIREDWDKFLDWMEVSGGKKDQSWYVIVAILLILIGALYGLFTS